MTQQEPERLRRVKQACSKIYQSYVYNRTTDKKELEFSIYAQRYPQNVRTQLSTVARARLSSPQQFEINENGDLQQEFGIRECLVYSLFQRVMDPRNPETNVLSYCTPKIGVYSAPLGVISYDDLGNPTGSEVSGWVNRFWIPFTRKTVEDLIQTHGGRYKNLVLGEAQDSGDSWYGSNTYTIKNLEEFISAPFEDLLNANRGSFLKEEYGGVTRYQKHRENERKVQEVEVKKFQQEKKRSGKTKE